MLSDSAERQVVTAQTIGTGIFDPNVCNIFNVSAVANSSRRLRTEILAEDESKLNVIA
jgi:hypothetical protein